MRVQACNQTINRSRNIYSIFACSTTLAVAEEHLLLKTNEDVTITRSCDESLEFAKRKTKLLIVDKSVVFVSNDWGTTTVILWLIYSFTMVCAPFVESTR